MKKQPLIESFSLVTKRMVGKNFKHIGLDLDTGITHIVGNQYGLQSKCGLEFSQDQTVTDRYNNIKDIDCIKCKGNRR